MLINQYYYNIYTFNSYILKGNSNNKEFKLITNKDKFYNKYIIKVIRGYPTKYIYSYNIAYIEYSKCQSTNSQDLQLQANNLYLYNSLYKLYYKGTILEGY